MVKLSGAELITAERKRRIEEEGCSAEHDDAYTNGEMALAARCYALPSETKALRGRLPTDIPIYGWPWAYEDWKPKDQITDLVRAGALLAAEIDRLERQEVGDDG